MACGPITSWEIDGETVADFIFWGSQITADGDRSHDIKTLTPWKESYDQHSESESEDAQSYPTLSDPMDSSLPGSSVHGTFQGRVLEWGAFSR